MQTSESRGFTVSNVAFRDGKTFDGNPLKAKNILGACEVLGRLIVDDKLVIHQNENTIYASWKVTLPDGSFVIADPGDFISLDENNQIIEVIKLI